MHSNIMSSSETAIIIQGALGKRELFNTATETVFCCGLHTNVAAN